MNEKDIDGRKLTVNVAEEKERPERSNRPRFERKEVEEDEYSKYCSTVGK